MGANHKPDLIDILRLGHNEALPTHAKVAFWLDANEYNAQTRVQLQVEYAQGV